MSRYDRGEIACFSDVEKEDWYFDSVCYVEQNGLFFGVSDTEFAPDASLTRAMFLTILYRATDGQPQTSRTSGFDDVPEGAYYADAVGWALEHGIITGVSERKFAPDQNMTREEMAAVIRRYAGYKGLPADSLGDLSAFADADAVSGWAREAVAWAGRRRIAFRQRKQPAGPPGRYHAGGSRGHAESLSGTVTSA